MKSLFITLLTTALFITNSFAQSITDNEMLASITDTNITNTSETNESLDYTILHTQTAANQIINHLNTQLEYPEVMADNSIEGTVEVKVIISKTGDIKKLKIAKSLSPEFDQAVLNALDNLKKLSLNNEWYQGRSTINVPVSFNLKN